MSFEDVAADADLKGDWVAPGSLRRLLHVAVEPLDGTQLSAFGGRDVAKPARELTATWAEDAEHHRNLSVSPRQLNGAWCAFDVDRFALHPGAHVVDRGLVVLPLGGLPTKHLDRAVAAAQSEKGSPLGENIERGDRTCRDTRVARHRVRDVRAKLDLFGLHRSDAEVWVDVLEVVGGVEQAYEREALTLCLGEGVEDVVRVPCRHDAEAKVHRQLLQVGVSVTRGRSDILTSIASRLGASVTRL